MHLSRNLLWCLALTPLTISASSLSSGDHFPLQIHTQSWLSHARDSLIRSVWRVPQRKNSHRTNGKNCPSHSDATALQTRYGGDLVLRFEIKTHEEAKALADAINILFLDVWEFAQDWVDIRLSKDIVDSLLGLLPSSLQHAHTPLMHDLAKAIHNSYQSSAFADLSTPTSEGTRPFNPDIRQKADEPNIFFRNYQPLSVITPWLRLLRSLFPTHVRLVSIGTSYEGRDIPALRVGVHPTNSEKPLEKRKTIIIAGGAHAREWISTSTVNYVAYSFITAYGRDREITKLLQKFDFLFIPTLNPDGYAYTWESDRLWRKNRQQTSLRFCRGLDLDRAYGFEWDTDAISNDNPCSESFSGESPFEAVEAYRFAQFVRNETANNNVDFVGYLDLHSYSQQILYPYSYSCTSKPPNLENLEELAVGLAKAIRLSGGESYGIISACEGSVPFKSCSHSSSTQGQQARWPRMETGGGSALDWMYHEIDVRHSFQLKLRDTGSYGFLLPSENIVPTGKEIFKAVEYFAQFLSGNKGIEIEDNDDAPIKDPILSHPAKAEEGDEWSFVDVADQRQLFYTKDKSSELRRRRR